MRYKEVDMDGIELDEERELLRRASDARERAYAPYSGFHVGAAVLTCAGGTFAGCNVENASYGLTICAERAAIASAVATEGEGMRLRAVAVAGEQGVACPPCGACRQVIAEFGPSAIVLFHHDGEIRRVPARDLLPATFELPDRRGED